MEEKIYIRNRFMFGFGTLGRDMIYSLVNMFLLVYITNILKVDDATLGGVTIIMFVITIFDAANDPVMGLLVDNTKTRIGKFKPWIIGGGVLSGFLTVLLFSDSLGNSSLFLLGFTVVYLLWTMAWTANDISYWSMIPSLSKHSFERESTGAVAKIFSSIGMFLVVVLVPVLLPVSEEQINSYNGNPSTAFTLFALVVVLIAFFTQSFTVLGVKEGENLLPKEKTGLRDMLRALFKNDQLLLCAVSLIPFVVGGVTTVSLGIYYFEYIYGDVTMFSVIAILMGAAQLVALALFPQLCKFLKRKQIFAVSMLLLTLGYIGYFLAPPNIFIIGASSVILFVGLALIQMVMIVCLADIVEYGEYKLHKRNESVTFSAQSFVTKLGNAIANGLVSITLIVSGINSAKKTSAPINDQGIWIMKIAMFLIPLLLMIISFIIIHFKYKIDEKFYKEIVDELHKRKSEPKTRPGE